MRKRSSKSTSINVILDAIITDLDTRSNGTTVGVLKSLRCLSLTTLIEKDKVALSETCLAELKVLCHYYSKDLSGDDDVKRECESIHAFLNAWEFDENEAVPRDIKDLLIFWEYKSSRLNSRTTLHCQDLL